MTAAVWVWQLDHFRETTETGLLAEGKQETNKQKKKSIQRLITHFLFLHITILQSECLDVLKYSLIILQLKQDVCFDDESWKLNENYEINFVKTVNLFHEVVVVSKHNNKWNKCMYDFIQFFPHQLWGLSLNCISIHFQITINHDKTTNSVLFRLNWRLCCFFHLWSLLHIRTISKTVNLSHYSHIACKK